jgi:hypothetical protein
MWSIAFKIKQLNAAHGDDHLPFGFSDPSACPKGEDCYGMAGQWQRFEFSTKSPISEYVCGMVRVARLLARRLI